MDRKCMVVGSRAAWMRTAVLVVALLALLLGGCERNTSGQLPEPGGEAIQATAADEPTDFGLVRAWPDQKSDGVSLVLEFSRPLVGTQEFDRLLTVEPAGSGDSGWSRCLLSTCAACCSPSRSRVSRPARCS